MTTSKRGHVKPSRTIVICVTVVIAMEILGGAGGFLAGRDLGQLLTFFTIINGTAVPAVVALVKQEQTEKKVEAVNDKVNGHLSRLTDLAVEAGQLPEAGSVNDDKTLA